MAAISAALAPRPNTITIQLFATTFPARTLAQPAASPRTGTNAQPVIVHWRSDFETTSAGLRGPGFAVEQIGAHRIYGAITPGGLREIYDPRDNTVYAEKLRASQASGQTEAELIRAAITRDELRVVGYIELAGHRALELEPIHHHGTDTLASQLSSGFTATVFLNASTLLPERIRVWNLTTTWSVYREVPASPASRRLLSLTARYPTAKIVYGQAAYLRATRSLGAG